MLDVPAASTLPEVHELLQAGIGWTDSHLHEFVVDDDNRYGPRLEDLDHIRDETDVALRALPARFAYHYDFGDSWEHDVEVLGPGGPQPGCIDGHGACLPEDVGGSDGYAEFLARRPAQLGRGDDPGARRGTEPARSSRRSSAACVPSTAS